MAETSNTSETKEPSPEAQAQMALSIAFLDRINNLTSPAVNNASMREVGMTADTTPEQDLTDLLEGFDALQRNVSAAAARWRRGETLPTIEELPGISMPDLKYTDYTDLSGPPITNRPPTS